MSIELDPVELGFRRPFTQEVTETLRLRNPNSDPVAFKVKTTAPKQYCVRPNSGRIEAGQQVEVQVLLQAMKEDPPLETKCRDKFLVQSVAVPADKDFTNVTTLWTSVEQTAKSSIQEKKIRVNFLPAPGTGAKIAAADAADGTPRRATNGPEDDYGSPMSSAATPATKYEETVKTSAVAAGSATAGAVTGAAATAANSVPQNQDELKRQLAAAQAQITQLKDQASEGLRQRKLDPKSVSEQANQVAQKAPGGISVPLAAMLCLVAFLIAYFLF